jgi:broad specificity phosphatase PhoE
MTLPIDLILVRHGQSEGNVANKASRAGDNSFFTPGFKDRHSREFRLTDRGIEQAETAGRWLKANVLQPLDRFYVSDHIRAKETAAHLNLPGAAWRVDFHLRERDKALMDNCPADEQQELFGREVRQYELDRFLSYPAGGGESIASLCLRLKGSMLDHWARVCSDMRIVAVCHGHVMRALQLELEHLGHDDFIRLDMSDDTTDKIRNCQVLWYSRRDPDTQKLQPHPVAVRSVCPWNTESNEVEDHGWRRIERSKKTNEELLAEVERYPRHVK